MGNDSRIRAFIAIKIPTEILTEIARIQREIRRLDPPLRWTAPENIHITLKFLGDADAGKCPDVLRAMEESARDVLPYRLTARGIGIFPGVKNPRVLWVGMGGEIDRLIDTQRKLDHMLSASGFEKEDRPFRGHITLARFKGKADPLALSEIIRTHGTFESPCFTAERLILFKSDLKPAGPVYTELGYVLLRNPGAPSSCKGE